MYDDVVKFIREVFHSSDFIPLHEPKFHGHEKKYLADCIDSTFVSSVGEYVNKFENMITEYTGAKYAIAAANGTAALHLALIIAGVEHENEVITQPLSFIATSNAIRYCGAHPVYVDVDKDTLGLSPDKLEEFLKNETIQKDDGYTYNINTNKKIQACLPMHTFGHPCKIDRMVEICKNYNISLIEDAAESLGSTFNSQHTGTFGKLAILSFNGNKILTTGGGGMILTDDCKLAKQAKHLSTQAKLSHQWEYIHDEIGFNYRMPNLNAALGCAQLEQLPSFVENKRNLARNYNEFFSKIGIDFFSEPQNSKSNYWLNTVILEDEKQRDVFLKCTNENGVMTRPVWRLLSALNMYQNFYSGNLENALWLEKRLVNIPSSVTF